MPQTGMAASLAAIVFQPGDGPAIEHALAMVAARVRNEDFELAGALQLEIAAADGCRCDLVLVELSTGRHMDISEKRGAEAQGCRLDTSALEAVAGLVASSVEAGADLLIVNRFGKREAQGGGFRSAIETAVAKGVPVLVAVNAAGLADWQAFAEDLDERLPLEVSRIEAWCRDGAANRRSPVA
jgi:nucleoside-triphosphatase THEP1